MLWPRFAPYPLVVLTLVATAGLVAADSNDWVNADYVLKQSSAGSTTAARQNIVSRAGSSAKSGPWSIVNKSNIKPPSGDIHDYLSWAPYHWPDCNWCSKGTNHLSGPNQGDNSTDDAPSNDDSPADGSDPYEDGGADFGDSGDFDDPGDPSDFKDSSYSVDASRLLAIPHLQLRRRGTIRDVHHGYTHRRIVRRRHPFIDDRTTYGHASPRDDSGFLPGSPTSTPSGIFSLPTDGNLPVSTDPPEIGTLPTLGTGTQSSTVKTISGTPAPAQAPAKTSQHNKCTPSPAKPLAASATWTTCPYAVRDGRVNPDVRSLPDSPAVVRMSETVLYNAVAFALQKTRSFSQNAVKFIDTFFLASATAMNPNMNYGQQVRGPGKAHQMGTFTGILDLRGLVKVVNAIQLLKASNSPDWTAARDKAMTDWMRSYVSWLENSAIGKETASKANNHLSFYVSQLAAAKMYIGDIQGAQAALQGYFAHQFQDQVAASGEQPFEAVRTRAYHYRCFNLEAMITNAKLGDQLGMDFWTTKSKYGATIQTALDYTMGVNPKHESIDDIFPHVAAVAAAYGDPNGKYQIFLKSKISGYQDQPFWFYDQSDALPNSPAGRSKRRRDVGFSIKEADASGAITTGLGTAEEIVTNAVKDAESGKIPFECPDVFLGTPVVELEDGLFVTCDQVEPYYDLVAYEGLV